MLKGTLVYSIQDSALPPNNFHVSNLLIAKARYLLSAASEIKRPGVSLQFVKTQQAS